MEYKIILVNAVKGWGTNFEKAATELSDNVNNEIEEGWEPLGGVNIGTTQSTKEPFLLQAMIRH